MLERSHASLRISSQFCHWLFSIETDRRSLPESDPYSAGVGALIAVFVPCATPGDVLELHKIHLPPQESVCSLARGTLILFGVKAYCATVATHSDPAESVYSVVGIGPETR